MSFPPNLGITNSFIIDYTNSPLLFPSLLPHLDQISSPFSRTKMNGYTRIRKGKKPDSTRSKSLDFSDLSFSYHTQKFNQEETKTNLKIEATIPEEGNGEAFGVILSRKCTIHTNQAIDEEGEEASSKFQTILKSVSIKRSSSVSDAYSRIHHQADFAAGDDDQFSHKKRYVKNKKGIEFLDLHRLSALSRIDIKMLCKASCSTMENLQLKVKYRSGFFLIRDAIALRSYNQLKSSKQYIVDVNNIPKIQ